METVNKKGQWSSGMILALGAEFDSPLSPILLVLRLRDFEHIVSFNTV